MQESDYGNQLNPRISQIGVVKVDVNIIEKKKSTK